MSQVKKQSRLAIAALTFSLFCGAGGLTVFSAPASATEEKPDLSDFVPRSSKLSYGKDKEFEKLEKKLEKAEKKRASVHNVSSCSEFVKLFEKQVKAAPNKRPLLRGDTVRVGFKKACEIKETVVVNTAVRIESKRGVNSDKFIPYYTQQSQLDVNAIVNQRETVYTNDFLCNTRAAPCFLVDTPDGHRTTISGLKFSVKEALYAPLIQARSGWLTASYNYFSGSTLDTGSARQGPAILAENQSATITSNTFRRMEAAVMVYPYMAQRTGEFENAFKIGSNVIEGSYSAIELDGTYRFGVRPEVKVYVYGNLAASGGVGILSRDVRAFHFRNILQDIGTGMDISGGEALVEQNIFRNAGTGIYSGRDAAVYVESNLFENIGAIYANVLDMFEGGSPYPTNNLCRNQDLASQYKEGLTRKIIISGGTRSEVPLGKRWGRKTRIAKEFAASQANVQSHILFARPFELNPADGYKNCFDYSSIVALDAGQLDKYEAKAHLRPSRGDDFFQ